MKKINEVVELKTCVCCSRPIIPGDELQVPEGWIHRTGNNNCKGRLEALREVKRLENLKEINGGKPLSPEIY